MEKWSKNNHLRLIIITALAKKYGFTNRYVADIVAHRKTTAKMEQILLDYTTLSSKLSATLINFLEEQR